MSTPQLLPWERGGGNLIEDADSQREALSHTRLSSFLQCPQKYAYSYLDRLEPVSRPEAFSLGAAYQLSVEHSDPLRGAQALREQAIIYSQVDEDRLRVNETIVEHASALYLRKFLPPTPYESAKREFGYRVRLRNPLTGYVSRGYDLLGYADEWINFGTHAALVENKLVGQITEANVRKLPLDRQLALEAYGTWRATGKEVREVFYRWMRKPSIRQKKGEDIAEFCERIADDYLERPDFYAHEEHFMRTSDDLLRTELELWEWAVQLRRVRRGLQTVTRNTSVCADYGGCAFMALCLGEPADGLYRTKTPHAARNGSTERQAEIPALTTPLSPVATV